MTRQHVTFQTINKKLFVRSWGSSVPEARGQGGPDAGPMAGPPVAGTGGRRRGGAVARGHSRNVVNDAARAPRDIKVERAFCRTGATLASRRENSDFAAQASESGSGVRCLCMRPPGRGKPSAHPRPGRRRPGRAQGRGQPSTAPSSWPRATIGNRSRAESAVCGFPSRRLPPARSAPHAAA